MRIYLLLAFLLGIIEHTKNLGNRVAGLADRAQRSIIFRYVK